MMWLLTGILFCVFITGCLSQDCPRERRIEGFRCNGRGMDVTDCPAASTCMMDRSGGSFCCWDEPSAVEAPCEDPMTQGGSFVQCTPGDRQSACPGRCHNCNPLGNSGMGLCCPQVTRQGCENSSPLRNEFEAARRRIQGSSASDTSGSGTGSEGFGFSTSGSSGGSMMGSRGMDQSMQSFDTGSFGRFSGVEQFPSDFGQGSQSSGNPGIDFGMTSASRTSPMPSRFGGSVSDGFSSGRTGIPGGSSGFGGPGMPFSPGRSGAPTETFQRTEESFGRSDMSVGGGGGGGMISPEIIARQRALLERARAIEIRRRMMAAGGGMGPGGVSPMPGRGRFIPRF